MFLDTSVIIELMRGENEQKANSIIEEIGDEPLFISVVQLGEINDWCRANGSDSLKRISQIKEIVNVVQVYETTCQEASEIKFQMRKSGIPKFSLMDGIILASSRMIYQNLLTLDNDFRKAGDAILIR
jgi:predicted nucleic acid-binding protein